MSRNRIERAFKQGADVKAGEVLYGSTRSVRSRARGRQGGAGKGGGGARAGREAGAARGGAVLGPGRLAGAVRDGGRGVASGAGRSRRPQGGRRAREAQSRLHQHAFAHQRPDRPRPGHEGALVGQGEATHLATVQQLDPSMRTSPSRSSELHQLRRDLESGALKQVAPDAAKVQLVLERRRRLSASRAVAVLRRQRRSRHRAGDAARRIPQSESRASARHVCARADRAGHRRRCARRPAAGGPAQQDGRQRGLFGAPGQAGRAQASAAGRVVDEHGSCSRASSRATGSIVEGFQKFAPGDLVDPMPWRPHATAAADAAGRNRRRTASAR